MKRRAYYWTEVQLFEEDKEIYTSWNNSFYIILRMWVMYYFTDIIGL
jgi:hypothetical protein